MGSPYLVDLRERHFTALEKLAEETGLTLEMALEVFLDICWLREWGPFQERASDIGLMKDAGKGGYSP